MAVFGIEVFAGGRQSAGEGAGLFGDGIGGGRERSGWMTGRLAAGSDGGQGDDCCCLGTETVNPSLSMLPSGLQVWLWLLSSLGMWWIGLPARVH